MVWRYGSEKKMWARFRYYSMDLPHFLGQKIQKVERFKWANFEDVNAKVDQLLMSHLKISLFVLYLLTSKKDFLWQDSLPTPFFKSKHLKHFFPLIHISRPLCMVCNQPDVTTIVFCYQNCSDLLWEKKCSSDCEKQFIQTVKGQNNFW